LLYSDGETGKCPERRPQAIGIFADAGIGISWIVT
jgi:hypothetical protein